MLSAPARLRTRGAAILYPGGVSGVVVPANSLFPASSTGLATVQYKWPNTFFLRGVRVSLLGSGSFAKLAKLSLQIYDETNQLWTTDGQGQANQSGVMFAAGIPTGLARVFGGRFFALQRIVRAHDIWKFRWANSDGTATTPELAFLLAERDT